MLARVCGAVAVKSIIVKSEQSLWMIAARVGTSPIITTLVTRVRPAV
jgi:hypothetical protein